MSPSLSLLSAPAGQVLRLALCSSSSLAASTRPRLAFARRTYASAPSSTAHPTTLAQQSPVAADQQKTDDRLQDLAHAEGPHFRDQVPVVPAPTPSSSSFLDALPSTSSLSSSPSTALADLSTPFHGPWTLHSPVYTPADLAAVRVVHRPFECTSDRLASRMVWLLRKGFDLVSGYRHVPMPVASADGKAWTTEELRRRGSTMTPDQWMMRILFLESIAGVPGMVAGALRHLHSLRLMKRDGGWIHTLLEEAENERMHLMTFMAVGKPSLALRTLILVGQGVFYNAFFVAYLLAPRVAHRFVGCLEEEAVLTYERAIRELRDGHLPEWENIPAPEIAVSYWRMKEGSKMIDVLENVRADESAHRFVNHTLASLDQQNDFNPFALGEPPAAVKGALPGFSREEAGRFAGESRRALLEQGAPPAAVERRA